MPADEAVLIAADEAIALRLGVGLHAEAERLRDGADVAAEIGLVEAEHHQLFKRKQRQEHVGVDIGDDRAAGTSDAWRSTRAELAFLLAGHREETGSTAAAGVRFVQARRPRASRRRPTHCPSRRCRSRSPLIGFADAEVIEVRRDHDVLVLDVSVRPAQDAGDVLRLDVRASTVTAALIRAGSGKGGSGLPGRRAQQLLKVWPEPASSLSACADSS